MLIQPGIFLMGGDAALPEPDAVQKPPHQVELTRPFRLATHEVTQAEWAAVMATDPSYFAGCDRCPVESVSWLDAVLYCNRRSELEQLTPAYEIADDAVTWRREADGYRLPTEAEWEYACRAGTTTRYHTGDCLGTDQANFNGYGPGTDCPEGMYRAESIPVGSFTANAWGLYDMHGNVFEWCWDWRAPYPEQAAIDPTGPDSGQLRTLRGGCWASDADRCRAETRQKADPGFRSDFVGFRVARSAK
ncbi:MAG: formylglycine-generating enzyme family protein [bacterium]